MDLQNTPLQAGIPTTVVESRDLKSLASRVDLISAVNRSISPAREATEVLVPDTRAELSPAQSVERKLTSMLRGGAIPVSHIRLARLCGKH